MNLADNLVGMGVHSLAIKDMAGLLTPQATSMLVGSLRKEYPDMPLHVHTHDTAGLGVSSMLAAAEAGADIVDGAIDAMSGMTSQPSLGALVANLKGTPGDCGVDLQQLSALNSYWEDVRSLYGPFESGQLSGSSDVYYHEIPGSFNMMVLSCIYSYPGCKESSLVLLLSKQVVSTQTFFSNLSS